MVGDFTMLKNLVFMITDLSDLKPIDTFDTNHALSEQAYTAYRQQPKESRDVERLLSRVINQPLVTSSYDPPRRDHVLKVKAANDRGSSNKFLRNRGISFPQCCSRFDWCLM